MPTIYKIKRFINKFKHRIHLAIAGVIYNWKVWDKLKKLCLYLLEIAFMGYIIYYAVNNSTWIGWCARIAVLIYSAEWLEQLIKRKNKD